MVSIKLNVRDKHFELDSSILFRYKYFNKLFKLPSNTHKSVDFTDKVIDMSPNDFREIMRYAKDSSYKISKKHMKIARHYGIIDEYDTIVQSLKKKSNFVCKINDSDQLFNFFKFIEKTDVALLKTGNNNKLVLNIVSDKEISFTHIKLDVDEIFGSIKYPVCITNDRLSICNKFSDNPIIMFMKNKEIYLITKIDNMNVKWSLCVNKQNNYNENPPDIKYDVGIKIMVGSMLQLVKMDNKIQFNVQQNIIKICCGDVVIDGIIECDKKFKLSFDTKNIINFLKKLKKKSYVNIYVMKNYPLKLSLNNIECYIKR